MKLKRGLLAFIGACQYKSLPSEASETPPNDEFLSKFETGNFPDIPKVTLDMFNVVDRYTAIVYDNQKHQANAYKSELSQLKTGLFKEIKGGHFLTYLVIMSWQTGFSGQGPLKWVDNHF